MSECLDSFYQSMWQEAKLNFSRGECSIDKMIGNKNDTRRGITLLARPNQIIANRIIDFQNELKKIDSNQYFQPTSDLHMTILSIISCYAGFTLDQISLSDYQSIINQSVSKTIKVRFEGVTASNSAILIQGYPEDNDLDLLRENLRSAFKTSELQNSIDSRYKINTAHMTVMRFYKPMENHLEFTQTLEKYRDYDFGTIEIKKLNLVFNDWYQRREIVKDLATFDLG